MLVNSVERHESVLSQVVHGCRQLVSWDVRLSPATSATLVLSCHHSVGNSRETADVKSEEGGDDVKSSCPLWPGRHTCYNGRYKETRTREGGQISESRSQYGLKSATRLHEAGIASNRESAMSRWIRSRGLYTPPVKPWELVILEAVSNKVSLRERGDGSPPFYGERNRQK